MSRKTRRRFVAALGAVAAIAAAGFAIAYFTSAGSGSGTASVGTSTDFTITGTTSGSLYPGTTVPVKFSVHNPGSGNQHIGTVSLSSVAACSVAWSGNTCNGGSAGVGDVSCTGIDPGNAADANGHNFYMADVAQNITIAPGATVDDTTTPATVDGTLKMNNLSSPQDSCKNANLLLGFTSN